MSTVTLDDAQKRLGELVQRLASEKEMVLTDAGKPVARLVPVTARHSVRDHKAASVGGLLKPFPDPDDDILGEMLEGKSGPR